MKTVTRARRVATAKVAPQEAREHPRQQKVGVARAKKSSKRKKGRTSDAGKLAPEHWRELNRLGLEEQRQRLDPEGPREIVARIGQLAARVKGLKPDDAMAPGIECIANIASDLGTIAGRRLPKRRGEIRERHMAALAKVGLVALPLLAHHAFEDAASFGDISVDDDDQIRVQQTTPAHDDDAISLVKERLNPYVRRSALEKLDAAILKVVKVYRAGVTDRSEGLGRKGKPRKGLAYASLPDRCEALNGFLTRIDANSRSGPALAKLLSRGQKKANEWRDALTAESRREPVVRREK